MIPIVSNLNGHKVKLLVFSTIVVLLGCVPNGYVKYRPVDYDMHRGGYLFSKSPISNQHLKGIKFVFDYYGVDYIEKDSQTLFIPLSVLQDTNFVFNCTDKADDPVWVEYKKKELRGDFTNHNNKGKFRIKPLIIAHSTKGQPIAAYFTDVAGNRIRFADTNQTVFFNILMA
ncbi:MAG: hypothetical protein JW915_22425 [Chitinispirillaceae bacterium]|nr:hypothetical protein [Chitinispirillaceae bacterium]